MSASVFDLAIPAPFDASFTDGERALSCAATIGGAAARTQYHVARWLNFLGGIYTVKMVSNAAAVMWVGSEANSLRAVAGSVLSNGVIETQVYVQPGQQRVEFIVQNLLNATGPAYVAFSISQGGNVVYASTGTSWLFDTALIPDSALLGGQDQRRLLPVFTILPNWADGITETIGYLTDVMASESDDEQTRTLIETPRRSFDASFLRKGSQRARLDNFLVGVGTGDFMFPLWHEQYHLPADLSISTTGITLPSESTVWREFRVGDLVLIINRSPDDYEIVEIADINFTTDRLTWVTPNVKAWPQGTAIIPMRRGRITDQASLSNVIDRVATIGLRFRVVEHEDSVDPSWGYCAPLFRFDIDRSDPQTALATRTFYEIDNTVGPTENFDPGQRAAITMNVPLKLFGRERVHAFRAFIAMARGRAVRFYIPSFVQGIVPLSDIGGTTFDAKPSGYAAFMARPQDARLLFGVVFTDGRPTVYRTIVGVAEIPGTSPPFLPKAERFTLDQPLPPIQLSSIERIDFVVPSRFDQDSFQLQHVTNDSAVVTTSIVTRSTDIEGMPPIECVVTSKPYPVVLTEGLSSTLRPPLGNLYGPMVEGMSSSLSVLDATFRSSLKTYDDGAPEALLSALSVGEATLHAGLATYDDGAPEAVSSSFNVGDGTFKLGLIPYDKWPPEALSSSLAVNSGTFT